MTSDSGGKFYYPPFAYDSESSYMNTTTINATTTKCAFFFIIPKTGTLSHICSAVRVVTTSAVVKVGLYSVSGLNPSDTLYSGNTATFTPIANGAQESEVNATVTEGDMVAAVFEWDSAQGSIGICSGSRTWGFPVASQFTTAWVRVGSGVNLWLKYSDGSYIVPAGCEALRMYGYTGVHSNSTPDQIGNIIEIPFDMEAIGIAVKFNQSNGLQYYLELFENSILVRQISVPAYISGSGSRSDFYFQSKFTCKKGNNYIIAIRTPQVGTNVFVYTSMFDNEAVRKACTGGSRAVQRTDNGAWTEVGASIRSMQLIVGGVPAPSVNRRTSTGR